MKLYLISLGAGVLVGVIYGMLGVRSPAPPVVALVGLLGILLGEYSVALAKRLISGQPVNLCLPHLLGELPTEPKRAPPARPGKLT